MDIVASCAVTTIVMVLVPTLRLIAAEADPLVTAVPLTVTVAWLSLTVGGNGDGRYIPHFIGITGGSRIKTGCKSTQANRQITQSSVIRQSSDGYSISIGDGRVLSGDHDGDGIGADIQTACARRRA